MKWDSKFLLFGYVGMSTFLVSTRPPKEEYESTIKNLDIIDRCCSPVHRADDSRPIHLESVTIMQI